MAIHIKRPHRMDEAHIRSVAEDIAEDLERSLDLRYGWEGNRLVFKRVGVRGHIAVDTEEVEVLVEKSRFLPVSESWIRERVEEYLDQHLQ